jgi:hypothetical protein
MVKLPERDQPLPVLNLQNIQQSLPQLLSSDPHSVVTLHPSLKPAAPQWFMVKHKSYKTKQKLGSYTNFENSSQNFAVQSELRCKLNPKP